MSDMHTQPRWGWSRRPPLTLFCLDLYFWHGKHRFFKDYFENDTVIAGIYRKKKCLFYKRKSSLFQYVSCFSKKCRRCREKAIRRSSDYITSCFNRSVTDEMKKAVFSAPCKENKHPVAAENQTVSLPVTSNVERDKVFFNFFLKRPLRQSE